MKYFQITSITTVYINQLKTKDLKKQYLLNYLKEIVKFRYPCCKKIVKFLELNLSFKYQTITDFNNYFSSFDESNLDLIFHLYPDVYPHKLIFLMDENNEAVNLPSYTDLLHHEPEEKIIELIVFNHFIERVKY